uniref:Stage V sporulation protein B n=1 Tax=uncultured Bacillota bacterium TaxID=344338 RepID=A0A650EQ78_9FIRM|nr:stage V sporulation protein B [uncultured Firmicutes bacterium]
MKEKERGQGQTFLKGALVLGCANLIVKIIGALFKVPLYDVLEESGSGLFNVAYQIYTFMFIIATAGFPIAISKMVAESIAKGDQRDAKRIFETAFLLLGIIGIIGSTVLFTCARPLANMLGNSDADLVIQAISPAVFFVAMVSAFRGYFQGRQNMYPTAASEIIEASAKLGIGLVLAIFAANMTVNPALNAMADWAGRQVISSDVQLQFEASGAILGVTVGTLLSFLLLLTVYAFQRRKREKLPVINARSKWSILKNLVIIAIPITIGASVSSLTSLIDLATVMNRLQVNPAVFDNYNYLFAEGTEFAKNAVDNAWTAAQILEKKANSLYGMYTGQAMTMFNLPLTLVVALGMSVVPAISALLTKEDKLGARKMTESVLRITGLFAMPCAIGMSVLSEPILSFLFRNPDGAMVLQKLSIAVIFVSMVSVTNAVLQAYGKVYYPVVNMIVGGAAKVIINYFFIPVWGIDGAPIATIVCYAIIAVLNIACIIRVVKIKYNIMDMIIKPLLSALIMGLAAWGIAGLLGGVISSGRLCTVTAICVGGIVYVLAIFLLRAVRKEDVLMLPKGTMLAGMLEKMKLLK